MPGGRSVKHDVHTHGVVFRVAGEGLQIPPGISAGIFSEYADAATAQGLTGTGIGLGLYVARAMARQMGGDLDVLTEPSGSGPQYGPALVLTLPTFEGQKVHD